MLLEVDDLSVNYGKVPALRGVSLVVDEGEVVVLIGANGAGKTTLLKALSGLRSSTGTIRFRQNSVESVPAYRRAALGIGQVPEGRRVFSAMTVLENLQLGTSCRPTGEGSGRDLDRVYTMFPRLAERRSQLAGTLSGGEQQMLAIGRALMGRPSLLLLDEPSMGLAPLIVEQIFAMIREINRNGTTVLLVEQNAMQALDLGQRGYVLESGRIVNAGLCSALKNDPSVRSAYLGLSGDESHPETVN
jgi:branched-chain amino acid transport system ATP-binding protein